MSYKSCLYEGQVYHRRTRPKEHVLRYSVFTLLLDLSELSLLSKTLWLFSYNRFNIFSFYDKDFGESNSNTLTEYVERKLVDANISTVPSRILLSCYPRILGLVFNPLSLFYCLDAEGRCFAVIHEVHNTFGERHAYVLLVNNSECSTEWIEQSAEKELFVSPFAHMNMSYQFRLNHPDAKQVIVIRASDNESVVITASYTAHRKTLTANQLLRQFLRYPLQTLKVVLGIHWEALRLYLKGVPWFKHQPKGSS
ncbi:DUF1365 domain-containing protein [Granulosicoccus sp.]|nr:DUF1365 family protein [Granulosicoccus sp.]MDB4224747.1 DUF1365 domain-containing protein [Granulosicoccus sp.]